MRGGGWTREARVEGADDGEAIGRRTTGREEWGGGHDAGRLGGADRGGAGRTTHARALVAGGGALKTSSKSYLKIVKTPSENRVFRGENGLLEDASLNTNPSTGTYGHVPVRVLIPIRVHGNLHVLVPTCTYNNTKS
jgi:hypothetical protein